MKPQDIGFLFVFVLLLLTKKPRALLVAGLISWTLAIPLFAKWVFFTAERLTWYGATCILTFLLFSFTARDKVQ